MVSASAGHIVGRWIDFRVALGPGFDFSDFRMAKDDADMRRVIARQGEGVAGCL